MNLPLSIARMRQFAPLMLVLLSAAVAVAAYMRALDYPFVSDDIVYLPENTKLAGLHLAELWRLFTEPYNSMSEFLPLRELSYWFDLTLFGLNPAAFRAHNILLYLLCLPLVYATTLELWRYFRPADAASAPWAAAAVTALFALHPALVESVVWISGRKYVLPNLFSMLALWLALRARRGRGLSAPHAAAAMVAFVAVVLSKSSYVVVAPLIAMLWVLFWLDIPAQDRRRPLLLWPLAILVLTGLLAMAFVATGKGYIDVSGGESPVLGVEAATRSLAVLGWLARLAVSPESRHLFYPVYEDPYLPAMVATGVAVVAAAAAGGVMLLRKRSLEGFALVVFLLLCAPYIQLVPFTPPSLVSDRYLALAVWPAVLLLVALSWRLNAAPRAALLLVIALSWGFQTVGRPRDWRSYEALLDADLRAYPGYYMPAAWKIIFVHFPQGVAREARETASSITSPEFRNIMARLVEAKYAVIEAKATGKPQKAMELLWEVGLDLKQPPVQAKQNLPISNLFGKIEFTYEAQWDYLAKQFSGDASVRYNTGLMLLGIYKYNAAAAQLRAATESQHLPESVRGTAFKNLGFALINSGHITEAEAPLRAALAQTQPDLRAYCLLSAVYKQAGRTEEAARAEADCHKHAPNEEMAR